MTMRSVLRSASSRLEIPCLFPECPSSWRFDFRRSNAEIRELRVLGDWHYGMDVPTSFGPAQGWICPEDDNHFIDGNPRTTYAKERTHG